MKLHNCIFIICCFILTSCSRKNNIIIIEKTTCNYTQTPLGIETPSPNFGWRLSSDRRNQSQSACQIIVADNEEDINAFTGNMWDSEKIISDRSLLVPYQGNALKPAKKYFWKVKVWDRDGNESQWSKTAWFVTGLFSGNDWQGALWIGYDDIPAAMRVVPGVHLAGNEMGKKVLDRPVIPLFRKEFNVDETVAEATLFISGLGQYEASLNGHKVGNGFLTPGWTHYDRTVLYNTYDVTSLLEKGKNAIGTIVGNGFYNINRERYHKFSVAYGEPKLIVLLRIRYLNGTERFIVSGKDWKTSPSPITFTSIYGGEDYDARKEQAGWDKSGFDDSSWKDAMPVTPPTGRLQGENDYPVAIRDSFPAKSVQPLKDGGYLYDFGQNASGIIEIKVRGEKGREIRLTPAELITADNQPNQSASGTPYYFSYILKGGGTETWRPRFTYYGFRYVKVEGVKPDTMNDNTKDARLLDLTLFHNRNASPVVGSFSCSNPLFNRTFDLINWAIKSNFQSVLTDCPHREKLGWLEQTYLMGGSVHFNFDIYHLYNKQIDDMIEAQTPEGLVPDIAPEFVLFESGFRDSPEWGSAAVILPWLIYKWYGDSSAMKRAWPMMTRYAEYLEGKSVNHILDYGLGDWFDLGPDQPGPAQLTPKALTATAIYYYDLKLLAQMAGILKKMDDRRHILAWSEEVKKAFNKSFVNPETNVIATGSQTSLSMPWCVGLVDSSQLSRVMQYLEDSIRAHDKVLTAGDIGFHFLLEALMNGGRSQLLYEMNSRNDVPGYGFQLEKGATALTESWPALRNVSNNHLMLGHLMEWFYAGLGGIGQSEQSAAYHEIIIKPQFLSDLTWVRTSFDSPYGIITSNWERKDGKLLMQLDIPVNTTALVYFPCTSPNLISEGGSDFSKNDTFKLTGREDGRLVYRIGSGQYNFTITTP